MDQTAALLNGDVAVSDQKDVQDVAVDVLRESGPLESESDREKITIPMQATADVSLGAGEVFQKKNKRAQVSSFFFNSFFFSSDASEGLLSLGLWFLCAGGVRDDGIAGQR